jgi:hypothetical protein
MPPTPYDAVASERMSTGGLSAPWTGAPRAAVCTAVFGTKMWPLSGILTTGDTCGSADLPAF